MGAVKNAMLQYCDDTGIDILALQDRLGFDAAWESLADGFEQWSRKQIWPYRSDGSRNPLWKKMDRPAASQPDPKSMPLERFDVSLLVIGAVLIGIIGATIVGLIGR